MNLIKIITVFLAFTFTLTTSHKSNNHQLQLTPLKHYLVLYRNLHDVPTQLNFKIDFNSTETTLSKEHEKSAIFIDRYFKNRIDHQMKFVYKNIVKEPMENDQDSEEEYHGVVGMKMNAEFFKGIKNALNFAHLKLWVKFSENSIQIIDGSCMQAIFPPFEIELETSQSTYYEAVEILSFNFRPNILNFLELLEKEKNPFTLTSHEFHRKLSLQFFNEVQTLPLQALLKNNCLKFSGSESYECNLVDKHGSKQKNKSDVGLLVFEFDPIVCTDKNAIELRQEGKIDKGGYYWSHIFLLFLQFVCLIIFKNRGSIQRFLSPYLRKKMSRSR